MPLQLKDLATYDAYKLAIKKDLPKIKPAGQTKFWIYTGVALPLTTQPSSKAAKVPAFIVLDVNNVKAAPLLKGKLLACTGSCSLVENKIAFQPDEGDKVPYRALKKALPQLLGKVLHVPPGVDLDKEGDDDNEKDDLESSEGMPIGQEGNLQAPKKTAPPPPNQLPPIEEIRKLRVPNRTPPAPSEDQKYKVRESEVMQAMQRFAKVNKDSPEAMKGVEEVKQMFVTARELAKQGDYNKAYGILHQIDLAAKFTASDEGKAGEKLYEGQNARMRERLKQLTQAAGNDQDNSTLLGKINDMLNEAGEKAKSGDYSATGPILKKVQVALRAFEKKVLAKERRGKQDQLSNSIQQLPDFGNADSLFPKKYVHSWKDEADRGLLKGGTGKEFGMVIKAWELVEKDPSDKHVAALEIMARRYIADIESRGDKVLDDTSKFKYEKCQEALRNIRQLRLESARKNLPPPPWDEKGETAARGLQARNLLEAGTGKPNDSRGAAESYWIEAPNNKKAMLFKPNDGEPEPPYGWKKGGGAAREVMVSAVNDNLKTSLGIDFGVPRSTLATIEHPNFKSDETKSSTKRTGAILEFVESDMELTDKLKKKDPTVIQKIAPEDTQKALLLDFVTLQLDRQPDNFLVKKNEAGEPQLVPIDAGFALPGRKAFEGKRRNFTANAAFNFPGGDQPFTPELQESILAMDEEKVVEGMQATNRTMASTDPNSKGMIEDETIEMTRRSILFLKKAVGVKPPLTPKAIGELYAFHFQGVLDAKPERVEHACLQAFSDYAENQKNVALVDEFTENDAKAILTEMGWEKDCYANMRMEKPAELLKILKQKLPNQAVLDETEEYIEKLGGKQKFEELKKTDVNLNTYDKDTIPARLANVRNAFNKRREEARPEELKDAVKKHKIDMGKMTGTDQKKTLAWLEEYEKNGGDAVFKKKSKKDFGKLSLHEKIYESLGGDAAMQEMKAKGLDPFLEAPLMSRIEELTYYYEFEGLGGMDEYIRLGAPDATQLMVWKRLDFMRPLVRNKKSLG